jgi:hypothetical protein
MIILDTINKSLEVVLGGAITTNQLPFTVSYVDVDQTTFAATSAASNDGQSNNTTAVTMAAAPGAGKSRQIKFISIHNKDTVSATITVQENSSGTLRTIWKGTLLTLETFVYSS